MRFQKMDKSGLPVLRLDSERRNPTRTGPKLRFRVPPCQVTPVSQADTETDFSHSNISAMVRESMETGTNGDQAKIPPLDADLSDDFSDNLDESSDVDIPASGSFRIPRDPCPDSGIKLLVTGGFHFGLENGNGKAREDAGILLGEMFETAEAEKTDLVILTGNVFGNGNPEMTTVQSACTKMRKGVVDPSKVSRKLIKCLQSPNRIGIEKLKFFK